MKPIKFVAAGDIHGDEQDSGTVKALLSFCADYRPDLVVNIGDNCDFRAIRRGADDTDQASSLQKDWDEGEDFIRAFFKFGHSYSYQKCARRDCPAKRFSHPQI